MENNMKAMREALDKIARCMDAILARTELDDPIHRKALEAQNIADGYLVAPARNCDVGTAEEQEARFKEFCGSHFNLNDSDVECRSCPLRKVGSECEFAWAQMPYDEGEAWAAPRPATEDEIDAGKAKWCEACGTECPNRGKDTLVVCERFKESEAGK